MKVTSFFPERRMISQPPQDRTQVFMGLLLKAEPAVYAFLRTQVLDRNDADDLFQECATVLWQKFDEFQPGTNFVAWACQIARHKLQHYHRSQQRRARYFSDELLELMAQKSLEYEAEIPSTRRALSDCIERLRPADRDVLERCYALQATVKGVAEELGRPLDTIKSVLKRSRRSLFDCIQRKLAQELSE